MNQKVKIKGAGSHNLKHIHVIIPKNNLTEITGVSDSGSVYRSDRGIYG